MTSPFLVTPPVVVVLRHVRITPAGETVVEPGNDLPRHLVRYAAPPGGGSSGGGGGSSSAQSSSSSGQSSSSSSGQSQSSAPPGDSSQSSRPSSSSSAPTPPPVSGSPIVFGDDDFHTAMLNLLPRGPIWRRDPSSILSNVLLGLAPTYTRSAAAALQLLVDINPSTTQNLLTEWEESLGLPDPCTAPNPSLAQRRAAVRAKFAARGSLSVNYFINLAAALGFSITITEFGPFVVGSAVGSPICGPAWANAWQVNAPQIMTLYFNTGESAVGDPLTTYDAGELVCRITRDAPAETTVFFVFS